MNSRVMNKGIIMKDIIKETVKFDDVYDLAENIFNVLEESDDEDVTVLAEYDTIKELIKAFIISADEYGGDINLESISIEPPDYDGYDGPWILSITDDFDLYCEKAIREGRDKIVGFEGLLYTRPEYINKVLKDVPWINHCIIFKFDDEEIKNDQKVCFDWDEDHKGFVFCSCIDGFNQKFRYRGSKVLDEDAAWDIVNAYCG